MKTLPWLNIAYLLLLAAVALVAILGMFRLMPDDDKVVVGDVWEYTPKGEVTPWKDPRERYRYKVLEIKEGFVLFQNVSTGRVDSSSIRIFRAGARKLP